MGKRKGKPKAKTRDEAPQGRSKDTNCDGQTVGHCCKLAQTYVSQKLGASGGGYETKLVSNSRGFRKANSSTRGRHDDDSFQRELREKLEQTRAEDETKPKLEPPLISISIAPGSRSASCATTPNSTCSLKSIGKQRHRLEEGEEFIGPDTQVPEGQDSSRLGSVSSCEVFACDEQEAALEAAPPPPPTTSGLEVVTKCYIRLVRHNNLQYFYLGALVYSVICMSLLPVFLSTEQARRGQTSNNCDSYDDLSINSETRTNNSSNGITSGGGGGGRGAGLRFPLITLACVLILLAVVALKFFIELKLHSLASQQRQQKQQQTWPPPPPPLSQLQNTKPQTGVNKLLIEAAYWIPHYLQVLAILLGFWLIIWPIGFVYYVTHDQQIDDCDGQHARVSAGQTSKHIPIILLSVAVYLLPHLTSEIHLTRAHNHHLRLLVCTCFPLVVVISLKEKLASHFPLTLTMTMLASVTGQLRHSNLMALVQRDTFDGASELIEAKVSLEQQRQQQETLLLSVLPAYVAEQVKRTMVKKMENVRGDNNNDDEQPAPGTGAGAGAGAFSGGGNNPDNNRQAQVLVSTSNSTTQTVHGPAHCARSLTLAGATPGTELQVQSQPLPNNGGGGSQLKVMLVGAVREQRHSFARASRLSSSLASGAAYISEALLNNVHPIGKSSSTTSSAVQATGSHAPSIAPAQVAGSGLVTLLPVSNSLNMQQSRRGFNELYIRTYNNVSLLYGDIVGFTRLCTQLSSSQLVRVLNNLFSHFDHLAERHRIMRIKIIGDCYYGVSGIPEFAVTGAKSSSSGPHRMHSPPPPPPPAAIKGALTSGAPDKVQPVAPKSDNHAINCVNMGLDMIQYIKRVNIGRSTSGVLSSRPSSGSLIAGGQQAPEAAAAVSSASAVNQQLPDNFELNMRIGIHTGHIHSGVIGLKKWQFDVWSNDVSVAMHCESSGVAGRVQVTEATAQHLRGAFTLERACTRSSRDTFLADRDINTYLIRERIQEANQANSSTPTSLSTPAHRQDSTTTTTTTTTAMVTQHAEMADEDRIREATIGTIRQTLLAAGNGGSGGGGGGGCTDDGNLDAPCHPMSACSLAELKHNDIRLMGLTFRDPTLNRQFDERRMSAPNHLLELMLLFLVLVLALHLVDYLALVAPDELERDTKARCLRSILIGGLLVGLCLLLVALPKPERSRHARLSSSSTGRAASYLGSSRAPSLTHHQQQQQQQHQNHQHKPSFLSSIIGNDRRLSTNWSLNETDTAEDGPLAGTSSSRSRSSSRLVKLISDMPIARKWRQASPHKQSVVSYAITNNFTWLANNWLTSSLILLAFSIAITSQAHLVCLSARHELQQLTVLIVLMALDLSPSLWGYRTRCCLLVGVILLQVTCLVLHVLTGTAVSQSTSTSDMLAYFRQRLCQSNLAPKDSQTLRGLTSDALLLVVALWSFANQRQMECAHRRNFLWRNRLNVDHEELEYISGINKVLLENILPSHVVEHYLAQPAAGVQKTTSGLATNTTSNRSSQLASLETISRTNRLAKSSSFASSSSMQLVRMSVGGQLRGPLHSVGAAASGSASSATSELYHEQHDSVAVMFASIPHFYEFYDESDISKQGLGCIALLNEIICDFDKLLLKNKFSRIEKIKTIGSTYMAAAGLRPASGQRAGHQNLLSARNSIASQTSGHQQAAGGVAQSQLEESNRSNGQQQQQQPQQQHQQLSQQKVNLICMIQFATSLMSALNGINKQSFQGFKLRVGVNAGPVIAGIIGAQRPFYDIWGDCVNIASRMESLGEVGRIQVEERTAKLLMECLCIENYVISRRGPIDVKGKGGMVTYFVDSKKEMPGPPGESCSRQFSASMASVVRSPPDNKFSMQREYEDRSHFERPQEMNYTRPIE